MNAKQERNAHAYEQIVAILTAVGRPMTMPEIAEHAMFRPLNATTRSAGQWLKHLHKQGVISRRGTGSRRATYALAKAKMVRGAEVSDSVIIRLSRDGQFQSVKAPAGIAVALEWAA